MAKEWVLGHNRAELAHRFQGCPQNCLLAIAMTSEAKKVIGNAGDSAECGGFAPPQKHTRLLKELLQLQMLCALCRHSAACYCKTSSDAWHKVNTRIAGYP